MQVRLGGDDLVDADLAGNLNGRRVAAGVSNSRKTVRGGSSTFSRSTLAVSKSTWANMLMAGKWFGRQATVPPPSAKVVVISRCKRGPAG